MIKPMFRAAVPFGIFVAGMTGGPMPSTVAAQERELEEIVVTATRRDNNIMDVPASVTAFGSETLENRQLREVVDLNMLVPNWQIEEYNGQTLATVRGITNTIIQGPQESSVATHINGVYITRTSSMRAAYSDLESVEALRGPQGTLYGRNATAGAMNIITKKPTDEFESRVSVLFGDYDRIGGTAMVSGPLADNFFARASIYYNDRDGYTENLFPGGQDLDAEELVSGKLSLRWLPSEDVTVDLMATLEERDGGSGFLPYTPPQSLFFPIYATADYTLEPHKAITDYPNEDTRKDTLVALNVEWQMSDNLTLRSTTGYNDSKFDQQYDSDGTSAAATELIYFSESDSFSQEIVLDISLANEKLDVLIGGFYYEDDVSFGFDAILGAVAGAFGLPPSFFRILQNWDQETTAYAGFLDATYHVSDHFRIYGGVRASYEEKDIFVRYQPIAPACGFGGIPPSDTGDDWDDWSPRAGLQWDFSENAMVYAQFQQGFRSGGFSSGQCNDPFQPEEVNSWEVGLKMNFNEGRGSLLASAFYYDYQDLQVQQLVGFAVEITNAAESEIYGFELEGAHLFGDYTTVGFRYSYLSAEYEDFADCDPILFPGNCSSAVVAAGLAVVEDLSGNTLTRAPEHTVGLSLDQQVPISEGELVLSADITYVDERHGRVYNRDSEVLDDYTLLNAFLTWTPGFAPNASVQLFGKNLFGEDYLAQILANGGLSINLQSGLYQPPRTWGVELALNF
ncbi:MAG: TonB-dependent receptor [Gammaproteobacteria bacterium]|nr:TonB-dependent receptor [Gammaproteobacteria bacterium]